VKEVWLWLVYGIRDLETRVMVQKSLMQWERSTEI